MEPMTVACACGNQLLFPGGFRAPVPCLGCGDLIAPAAAARTVPPSEAMARTHAQEHAAHPPARAETMARTHAQEHAAHPPTRVDALAAPRDAGRPPAGATALADDRRRVLVTQGQLDRATFPEACACCLGPAMIEVAIRGSASGSGRTGGRDALAWMCSDCHVHVGHALSRRGLYVAAFLALAGGIGPFALSTPIDGPLHLLLHVAGSALMAFAAGHLMIPRAALGPAHGDEGMPVLVRRLGTSAAELEFANATYGDRFAQQNQLASTPAARPPQGPGASLLGASASAGGGLPAPVAGCIVLLAGAALWALRCHVLHP